MSVRFAVALGLACAALGCASGPPGPRGTSELPELAAGLGRLILYRPNDSDLPLFHPKLTVDGVPVGELPVGSFLYLDRPPDLYEIGVRKQPNVSAFGGQAPTRPVAVEVVAGETSYLRFDVNVTPVWVESDLTAIDPIDAQAQLANLVQAVSGD